MQKKIFVLGLSLYFITSFCFTFSLNLNFNLFSDLLEKFNIVHFNAPWNDFVGTLFVTNTPYQSQTIKLSSDSVSCSNLLQWYYYNSQRWDRVRPLDNWTLNTLKLGNSSYWNLSITWWLYTLCSWDENWIYGQIEYTLSWTKSYIIAWTELNYKKNTYQTWSLVKSFQRFNWVTPLGYIWDSIWWIGFVWWELSWSENLITLLNSWNLNTTWNSINELFELSWTTIVSVNTWQYTFSWDTNATSQTQNALLWWLCIEGMASLSCNDKIQPNLSTNAYISSSSFISIKDILNSVRQKYLRACSSYKNINSGSLPGTSTDPYLCYIYPSYNTWQILEVDLSSNLYKNKFIVVKNADIKLTNSMNSSSSSLNLFVDNWNVMLSNWVANMQSFDWSWYVKTNWVSSWVLFKWNIYVNGLILWESGGVTTWYNHKLYFFGKIASLNTPCEDGNRKKQIKNMFRSESDYSNFVNLQNVFLRNCNASWTWSDGTVCWNQWDNYSFCSIITRK